MDTRTGQHLRRDLHTPAVYREAARIVAGHAEPAGIATMSAADRAFFAGCDACLPLRHRATPLIDHAFQDWRDVVGRITVPTLVVGGIMFAECMTWPAAHVPGSRLELFDADDLGSHFMFWENPTKFNAVLRAFLLGDALRWQGRVPHR
jgi:non-heme chloroperoxidase